MPVMTSEVLGQQKESWEEDRGGSKGKESAELCRAHPQAAVGP